MQYRRLGQGPLTVSEISFGTWLTVAGGVERTQAIACVHAALDHGGIALGANTAEEREEKAAVDRCVVSGARLNLSRNPKISPWPGVTRPPSQRASAS